MDDKVETVKSIFFLQEIVAVRPENVEKCTHSIVYGPPIGQTNYE